MKEYPIIRIMAVLALIILSFPGLATMSARAESYKLNYDLGYSGIPFPGGVISILSNFTNVGQLTIRVTTISLASDFWSNGTRQISSGLSFNLTASMRGGIDTPVLIPPNAFIGNHNVRATATWQYSNNSAWFNTNPVSVSKMVLVSQTIGSLFSSYATILLIVGLGIAGVIVVLAAFVMARRRKKQKPSAPSARGPYLQLADSNGALTFARSLTVRDDELRT